MIQQKQPSPLQTLRFIEKILKDKKAVDLVSIPLKGKTNIADYMLIASGTSKRHIASMAEDIHQQLKTKGLNRPLDGEMQGDWVVVDAIDVIVHLFTPETRTFYDLEKLWG